MRKIVFLLFFIVSGCSFIYAGSYVIGTNQVNDLLYKIEQGMGEIPPSVPINSDKDKWENLGGITLTANKVTTTYLDHNGNSSWYGFYSVNFAGKEYKQKEGTVISFRQPSLNESDYPEIPNGYSSLSAYFDGNDLSWLETLNLSGNDFHALEIDGNNIMPLKEFSLAGNVNLKQLDIRNCPELKKIDITGCNLNLPKISDIINNTSSATVNYEYQGKMSAYYSEVDLTDLLSANGAGASVSSWTIQPQSGEGNVFTFDSGMIGKTTSITIVNNHYPDMKLAYDIELLGGRVVDFDIDAAFTAIEVENLTNPGKQVFIGDEVVISVNAFACSAFKSFSIDGVAIALDENNQYRMTTTKSVYKLSAVSEEMDRLNELTSNYLRNGSFEYGLNMDWEYFVSDKANAEFLLSDGNKIFDDGRVGLKVDVNSLDGANSVYARTRVTVGCDSLYLLQFWAHGPEEAKLYVEIEGSEQRSILYEMRIGNEGSKGDMVAYHYPIKIDKSNYNKELVITFYFQSDVTREKSNDPNNCYTTETPGVTYYLDGLVLVDQNNDMHHDVFNTYLWNYNQVPNSEGKMWTAGDNDVSFDLPDGRRMWFFNDSFYGRLDPNNNRLTDVGNFVRNAVVIQDIDNSLTCLPVTNQGGQWTYFEIPKEDIIYNTPGNPSSGVKNVFWVGDALIEDGQVKVYLVEVYGNDRSYIGKFTYPELEFIGIEKQESFCYGYEKFFVEDDMIYLYANGGSGWTRTMRAARAELGDFNGKKGTWEFWNGTSWGATDEKYEVSQRGADDVIKLGEGNYVQLAMPAMSPEVYVRFAPSPEGPWEHETLVGVGDRSANFWYYMPNFHGQLPNGKYSISMSANYHGCLFMCKDCENQLFTDKYWYRPRYIQVDLLALSPYTTNKKDCAGVENGDAYIDDCGICVGGDTGLEPCLTGIVNLYTDTDYSGHGIGLDAGEYTSGNLINLGFEPNSLSSFTLDEGYVIELYADDNFQGTMKLFESGIIDLKKESFDNQTSSLIIRRKGLEDLEGSYAIQNNQSGLYMAIEGNSTINNALLVQSTFTDNDAHKFELKYIGKGYYAIINKGSDKTLGIVNQSMEARAYVEQWDGKEVDITLYDGEISAQYLDSPGSEDITKLIDKNVNTKFLTFHGRTWVQFKASVPYVLNRYSLTSANDAPVRDPKEWTLSGSNDGNTWTTLDTQSDISFGNRFEEQTFSINNTTAYSYYRLDMTCSTGSILQLAEWKLFANMDNPAGGYFDSQKFVIQDAGNGLVKIINKGSDMLLEILDGFIAEEVKVWQINDYNQSGGLWKLHDAENVSILEISVNNSNIVIYPNPASEFISVRTKGGEMIERIMIVNLSGGTIFNKKYGDSQVVVPLSDWYKGVYIVKVYTENGSYNHKIIKL